MSHEGRARELAHPSRGGAERESRDHGKWGSGGRTQRKVRGVSLVCLNIAGSRSGEDKRGTCGKGQPCHPGAPGHLGRSSTVCFGGSVRQQENKFSDLSYSH